MNLGKKIKHLREQKNILQDDLAKITGISQGALSHYELGNSTPKLVNLKKISAALGVDINYFIEASVNSCAEDLKKDEHEIVESWRALSPEQKTLTKRLIEQMINSSQSEAMVKKKRTA